MISIVRSIASGLQHGCEAREVRRAEEARFLEAKRDAQEASAADWKCEQERRTAVVREQEEHRREMDRLALEKASALKAALHAAKIRNRRRK